MKHKKKRRPNWPYRFTLLAVLFSLILYVAVQTLAGGMTFAKRSFGTDWGLAFVSSLLDATIAVWFIAVGASIGSFLNVVAYRLPLGRNIGGHSSCPYCRTPIDGLDNIPVLAWVKLRGRCRTCHLPISIQYPLVELTVAIAFFVVYASEFVYAGGNLPGSLGSALGTGGLMRISISSVMVTRIAVYLFALSGLIAAALIAVKARQVPFKLYLWCIIPLLIAALVQPEVIIVPWQAVPPTAGNDLLSSENIGLIDSRLNALASLLFGIAAGMLVARVISPLVYPDFDRSYMSSDPSTAGARYFLGAMAVAGALVGWQSVVALAWVTVASAMLAVLCIRATLGRRVSVPSSLRLDDLTVWVWLGLLILRAAWNPIYALTAFGAPLPTVLQLLVSTLLIALLAACFRRLTATLSSPASSTTPITGDMTPPPSRSDSEEI